MVSHDASMGKQAASGKPPAAGRRRAGSDGGPCAASVAPPAEPPRAYATRPLSALLPAIVRPAFRRRSPASVSLMSDWRALVGPELASQTAPRRFSGGTLTLVASGPTALELQHRTEQLIARLNGALGQGLVERIRFVQESFEAGQEPSSRAAAPAPVTVDGVPDGPLREALSRLGGRIASRR